ncbi:MAG: hypothetical protein WC307_04205 [Candidatus Nanoarchaeia archaeon]|jgi:hypothetical protein
MTEIPDDLLPKKTTSLLNKELQELINERNNLINKDNRRVKNKVLLSSSIISALTSASFLADKNMNIHEVGPNDHLSLWLWDFFSGFYSKPVSPLIHSFLQSSAYGLAVINSANFIEGYKIDKSKSSLIGGLILSWGTAIGADLLSHLFGESLGAITNCICYEEYTGCACSTVYFNSFKPAAILSGIAVGLECFINLFSRNFISEVAIKDVNNKINEIYNKTLVNFSNSGKTDSDYVSLAEAIIANYPKIKINPDKSLTATRDYYADGKAKSLRYRKLAKGLANDLKSNNLTLTDLLNGFNSYVEHISIINSEQEEYKTLSKNPSASPIINNEKAMDSIINHYIYKVSKNPDESKLMKQLNKELNRNNLTMNDFMQGLKTYQKRLTNKEGDL